ncbi:MFS transporter [Sphingomonas colocasiae]|uniref:MFS transporter n=2 Tax=Sphingomonas colocasiae TaxID=1848973 RepID=A0ABS7PS20_9SPHN|nr:MFS transporter [Sphingomonas colocasiae]
MLASERFVETVPFSRFHRRLLLIGGLGYWFDALDVGIVAFVLPVLISQWSLTGGEAGVIAAASSIGGIVGALLGGAIGDLLGRRAVMFGGLAVYSLATFATALSTSWLGFLVPRIIAGAGTSAESVIIAPYLSEFAARRFRGRFVGAITGFFSFGFVSAAVLGYLLVPSFAEGWRWALIVASLPIFMLLWWRRRLTESPVWLEGKGRGAEAHAICRGISAEVAKEGIAAPVPDQAVFARAAIGEDAPRGGITPLFAGGLIRSTMLACIIWAAMGICYYAFLTWIPSLLVARGFTLANSFGFSILIFGAQIPGFFSAALLNDRIGRRRVITLYLSGGALAALGLAVATDPAAIVVASVLLSFAMNGVYAGLYAFTPDLFPPSSRASGQGLAVGISRVGAMVSPILVGLLYPSVGFLGVFGATVTILAIAILAILFLRPSDTRAAAFNNEK